MYESVCKNENKFLSKYIYIYINISLKGQCSYKGDKNDTCLVEAPQYGICIYSFFVYCTSAPHGRILGVYRFDPED